VWRPALLRPWFPQPTSHDGWKSRGNRLFSVLQGAWVAVSSFCI
jgi:hypothetical protein